jgi:hypothetical protein
MMIRFHRLSSVFVDRLNHTVWKYYSELFAAGKNRGRKNKNGEPKFSIYLYVLQVLLGFRISLHRVH